MPRWLVAVLLLVALAYLGLCGVLYAYQRSMIYFPQAAAPAAGLESRIVEMNGERVHVGVRESGGRGAVLYFGGNAEDVGYAAPDLAAAFPGRALYLMHYRGYGDSSGKPSEAGIVADALALYDLVQPLHPGIVVIGRSLGSGVASYVASRRPVEKLALVTPFDSLAAVAQSHYQAFPVRWLMRDRYESIRYLPQYRGPLLVLRAGHDEVVPPANTDALLASLKNRPQVIDFPLADHNDISADPRYAEALREFLR
jgi:pimeloyl-ACP methyl ester carboxylesterase